MRKRVILGWISRNIRTPRVEKNLWALSHPAPGRQFTARFSGSPVPSGRASSSSLHALADCLPAIFLYREARNASAVPESAGSRQTSQGRSPKLSRISDTSSGKLDELPTDFDTKRLGFIRIKKRLMRSHYQPDRVQVFVNPKMAAHYPRTANRKRLADQGMEKLNAS